MNPLHLFYITNIRIMQDITNGRCGWCGTDELYVKYHDQEWGKLVTDDKTLFEFRSCLFRSDASANDRSNRCLQKSTLPVLLR